MSNIECSLVSIVVPLHNQAHYIIDCLRSIYEQSFQDWNCIIVDDGSTDKSKVVACEFIKVDPRFRLISQRNRGVSVARNVGIAATKSEYILPLDADDMIAPTYLEKTIREFENKPEVKLVYTGCYLFGLVEGLFDLPNYSFRLLLSRNMITATALYRRVDFDATSGYDPKLRVGLEDWDYWLTLLDKDSIVLKVDEQLFKYRQRKDSRNSSIPGDQFWKIRKYLYYKHLDKYKQYPEDPEILAYRIRILEKEIRDLQRKDMLGRGKRKISRLFTKLKNNGI